MWRAANLPQHARSRCTQYRRIRGRGHARACSACRADRAAPSAAGRTPHCRLLLTAGAVAGRAREACRRRVRGTARGARETCPPKSARIRRELLIYSSRRSRTQIGGRPRKHALDGTNTGSRIAVQAACEYCACILACMLAISRPDRPPAGLTKPPRAASRRSLLPGGARGSAHASDRHDLHTRSGGH